MLNFERILVLGSNSFSAAHFINYALEKTDTSVIGCSRSPEYDERFLAYAYKKSQSNRFAFHQLDLNKELIQILELVDDQKPDFVINFAAQGEVRNSWKWPEQWFETNCMGVVRLTEGLRKREFLKRYIAVSTPEVYGSTGIDIAESRNYQPSTPYAASKLAGELHVETLVKRYDFPAVFTRAANVYGIHQQLYRIIPRTIIYLKLGRKITLHGGGQAERAFIHARDVADATWQAATKGESGETYHIAPKGELRSIRSVVSMICDILGTDFENAVEMQDENYGQDARFSLDSSKISQELGWKPKEKFEEAIDEMIAWITDNWELISQQPLDYQHIPS